MAQKDYVSRAKRNGQRKKTSGSKKTSAKKAKSSPITLVLLIAVIAAFAGGLYFLKNNKSTPTTVSPAPKNVGKQINQNDIPPAPAPRWDYVDALVNPGSQNGGQTSTDNKTGESNGMSAEQQRILSMMAADRPQAATNSPSTYNQQVDRNSQNELRPASSLSSTPTSSASSQSWTWQCGSFKNKTGAESIKAQLALSGISSQIVFSDNLHRVLVGPYKTKDAANAMRSQLTNAGVQGCSLRG